MSQSLEFNQLTVLLMLIHIGILTETSVVPIAYIPDETIVKPCRSGTADCMFGDCKKIWMRKGKQRHIIIQCHCWPGYSGDWCNIYPPERMPWRGLLRTEGKDEITPVIQGRRKFRSLLDTWNELNLQYAGFLIRNDIIDSNITATDRLLNRFILFEKSLSDKEGKTVN